MIFRFFTDDRNLRLQLNPALQTSPILDSTDQGKDLAGCGATVIDNEVRMDFGDAGTADSTVLESQFVDKFTSGDATGILEDATGAGRHRLGFLTMAKRFAEEIVDLSGLGQFPGERGRERVMVMQNRNIAVAHLDLFRGAGNDVSITIGKPNPDDLVECLNPHRTCIHAQRPAQVSRNAVHPFKPRKAGVAGDGGQLLEADPDPGDNLIPIHRGLGEATLG